MRRLAPWASAVMALLATGCGATTTTTPPAPTSVATLAPPPPSPAAPVPASPVAVAPPLPNGTLPTLGGVAPEAGLAVGASGVDDWLPAAARVGDAAPISAPWIAKLEGEGATRWSLSPSLEVQGIVLDGTVELLDATDAAAPPRALVRWTAFRAPGGAVTLRAARGAPARVVLVMATRDGSPVGKLLRDPESGPAPRRIPVGKKARPMPLEIADLHDRAALRWGGGKLEARIAWDGKAQAAALDAIIFAATAAVGEHAHPGAWECLMPLRAAGEVIVAGVPQAVVPGVATCIPPDVTHAWKPAGTEPLVAIQIYAPAGAEQRFRELAAKDLAAAPPAPAAPAKEPP